VKWRAALALAVAVGLVAACSAGSGTPSSPRGQPADAHGSLSAAEYALAMTTAKQRQAEVTGSFIGATVAATGDGDDLSDADQNCHHGRLLHIRLVWKADAGFEHAGTPGAPHDGPRKALLFTVDPQTGEICATAAMYRNVGAASDETLLYGHRP
jgi:hypothetical protein